MRSILVALIFAIIIVSGCVNTQSGLPLPPVTQPEKVCTTITDQEAYSEVECGDVSYTEQVCVIRKLGYSIEQVPKTDLCISDSGCNGKPLGDCQVCTQAMTRCVLKITNDEKSKTGTWSVGANYSFGNYGFLKDPITHTIEPGQTAAFDFNQIYSPSKPINSASCKLFVTAEPSIEDCTEMTRSKEECRNVTKVRPVEREVCQ